jgi:hypothetical protein
VFVYGGTNFEELLRSTTRRFVAWSGAGLPFSLICGIRPRSSGRSRVAFSSCSHDPGVLSLGQTFQRLQGVQGLGRKR